MFSFQGTSLNLIQETQWNLKLPWDFSQSLFKKWWAKMDSLFCGKATPVTTCHRHVVKSRLSSHQAFKKWWAKMDSNHRPHDYQSCALASWAIGPFQNFFHPPLPGRCLCFRTTFEAFRLQALPGGGEYRDRTGDLLLARQALSQLS